MWIPRNESELLQAITDGLIETATFDAKARLPVAAKNVDVAIDVAAMANDGGVLLYGVAEDEHKRLVPGPIPLAGAAERVAQIIRTRVYDPPHFEILEIASRRDEGTGYLVVVVPLSPRAPHMVLADNEDRYYGRFGPVNIRLGGGEVERLFLRRQRWESDARDFLARRVELEPGETHPDLAAMHLVARPLVTDASFLKRLEDADTKEMLQRLVRAALGHANAQDPSLPSVVATSWLRHTGGWTKRQTGLGSSKTPHSAFLTIDDDGQVHLFLGRVGQRPRPDGEDSLRAITIFDRSVATNAIRFVALVDMLCNRASYLGPVDLGVRVNGLSDAVAQSLVDGFARAPWAVVAGGGDVYERTCRRQAGELKDSARIARELTGNLIEALTQRRAPDPFEIT